MGKISTRPLFYSFIVFALLVCSWTDAVHAQNYSTPFPVNLFEPAPGPRNFLATESFEIGEDMKPSLGVMFNYQYRPFAVLGCKGSTCGSDVQVSQVQGTIALLKHAIVSDFLVSFNFLKRFQAGLAVPLIVLQQGRHSHEVSSAQTGDVWLAEDNNSYASYGAVGDIRIHLKGRILGTEKSDGFGLSAGVIASLPMTAWTGQGEGYTGSSFLTVTAPQIVAGYQIKALRISANLGFLWREKESFYSAQIGHTMKYAGAVGYLFTIRPDVFGIEVFAEIYGQKSFVSENFTDMDSAPLMFLGGGRFNIKDFSVFLGAGGGIISGVGVPQVQGMLGMNWTPSTKKADNSMTMATPWDLDGDGIDNDVDNCPNEPEDYDGFEDEDGCPDPDNDRDGIPDGYDSCPNEPEDMDGFRDEDGCPDLDHDEDGIKEPDDKCPEEAEDYDGFEDEDGCPDPDNDGDGIPDESDQCPDLAEDMDGFEDEDGCPEYDDDNDGVPDVFDKCPKELETLNGYKDDDGCPDKGPALVIMRDDSFELKQKVEFKGKTTELMKDETFVVLDIIAYVIRNNKALRLSVESHTDARGTAESNLLLTKTRSDVIKAYLEKQGVDPASVETIGQGAAMPLDSNTRSSGRRANNRVDFRIIRPAKKVDPAAASAEDSGSTMDFTEDSSEEDTMDFSIEEEKTEEMEMDFSEDEVE